MPAMRGNRRVVERIAPGVMRCADPHLNELHHEREGTSRVPARE
jgi:hypothetical protein